MSISIKLISYNKSPFLSRTVGRGTHSRFFLIITFTGGKGKIEIKRRWYPEGLGVKKSFCSFLKRKGEELLFVKQFINNYKKLEDQFFYIFQRVFIIIRTEVAKIVYLEEPDNNQPFS